ncbi:MAG: DUF4825 domain-containing protein [Lachnospiraceae bacterium]|nr:DUF4825 domain-containing protein [Lachnospiraceae bacterium]
MKEIIITVSVLILSVMLIRHFFKGKISNRLQYALWLVVAVRLIVPVPALLHFSLGEIGELRIMDLVKRFEGNFGDITERLEQPISFTLNLNSPIAGQIAENVMEEDMTYVGGADGPTSVFLAGRIGFTWLDVLHWIWFGGMGAMAVWMAAVNIRFWRKLRRERREFLLPEEMRGRMQPKVLTSLRRVRIYTVEGLVSPCLYGVPGLEAVYLPEDVTQKEDSFCHVLTHEICHKRHGDGFWSLFRNLLLLCYWFHPLVWAAAILSKRDCELACDEGALLLLGEEERISYGKTLLSIITGKGRLSDLACTATTMTGSGRSVKERIRCIAEKPRVVGTAVTAVLILIAVACIFVFTNSPQFSGGTWESGEIYVMTEDKQIKLPDSIAGISGYTEEEGNAKDLIIYQVASDQEVGRFCTVSYEEAAALVEAGRSVVPLGSYGKNGQLREYMGLTTGNVVRHQYTPAKEVVKSSEKAPFAFDGKTEWEEDESYESTKKPFAFDGKNEWGIEEPQQVEQEAEVVPNGVPGTDSNTEDETTYMIPDEEAAPDAAYEEASPYLPKEAIDETDDTTVYLPEEKIITKSIPYNPSLTDCYIYLTADFSGVEEKNLEEMHYIDNELKNAAGEVIVTSVNRGITEKTFGTLAEHATQYLGDASAVVALVSALPFPEGVSYGETELTTGDTQKKSLRVICDVLAGSSEARHIDYDVLRFDGVMLFATIENLEECVFTLTEEDGSVSEEVVYNREELTEWLGFDSLWKDLDGEELRSWLEELHQRVIMSASYEYFAF